MERLVGLLVLAVVRAATCIAQDAAQDADSAGSAKDLTASRAIVLDKNRPVAQRINALTNFARATGVVAEEVRTLAAPILRDETAPMNLRHAAAGLLGQPSTANDATRALLESILVRKSENLVLQRTCLRALGKTITRAALLELVLKKEVSRHPYFGIRSDVCSALASLRVHERRALEVLCYLIANADPDDKYLVVPQEALLAFWNLTGRIHGVEDRDRPKSLVAESDFRRYLFSFSWSRPGVQIEDVESLQSLLWRKQTDGEGKRTRVRNAVALTAAAAAYRKDFAAIEAEWAKETGKAKR